MAKTDGTIPVVLLYNLHPLVKSFLAGSLSGTCSTVIFQPLDLVKTRIQAPAAIGQAQNATMLGIFVNVVRNDSPFALWRGLTPSLSRCVPGVGIYFCSLHVLRSKLGSSNSTALESVIFGASARSVAVCAMLPFTVIKTRFESQLYKYRTVRKAARNIYKYEGLPGLYSGLTATLLRDCPFSGFYLMFYTQIHKTVPQGIMESEYVPLVHFGCGVTSGCLAAVITQPADVIKTKMQLFPNRFTSIWDAVVYVYKVYGPTGYFKGLLPRTLRRTLMAAMAWTVYESMMKAVGLKT